MIYFTIQIKICQSLFENFFTEQLFAMLEGLRRITSKPIKEKKGNYLPQFSIYGKGNENEHFLIFRFAISRHFLQSGEFVWCYRNSFPIFSIRFFIIYQDLIFDVCDFVFECSVFYYVYFGKIDVWIIFL